MKRYEVEVNGKVYKVSLKELTNKEYHNGGNGPEKVNNNQDEKNNLIENDVLTDAVEVLAPMPGTVLNINVDVGSKVKEGDILCVLEAMKMENSIVAAEEGVIEKILVNKGDAVEAGQVLIKY